MNKNPAFVHVNIVARDWKKLAAFYSDVFGCIPKGPERDLQGEWIDGATGLENTRIRGIHLRLSGRDDGPTLEIFQYNNESDSPPNQINSPGIAHLAFLVDDVEEYTAGILSNGGSQLGQITTKEIESVGTIVFVYCRDPEGNIIELQTWNRRI